MIKQIHYKKTLSYNKRYNSSVNTIVEEIFNAESEGHIGYQSTGNINENRRIENLVGIDTDSDQYISLNCSNENVDKDYIDPKKLPLVERQLIYNLCYSSYTNIVVTGALGSGKTALVKYVIENIKNLVVHDHCLKKDACLSRDVNICHINFNKNYSNKESDKAVSKFSNDLYIHIYDFLRDYFAKKEIFDNFLEKMRDKKTNEVRLNFRRFVDQVILNNKGFNKLTTIEQATLLFNWIDKESDKLNILVILLDHLLENGFYQRCCLIFFFDNIDYLSDVAQNQIFSMIIAFAEKTKVKTVTCLRLTNFSWISGIGTFTFGHFPNAGPRPVAIVKLRIRHFLKHYQTSPYKELLGSLRDKKDLIHLINRMEFILNLLEKKRSRVYKTLDSLSGNSIRRSLQLSKKMFRNGTVSYDQGKPYEDTLSLALLQKTTNLEFPKFNNNLVTNLFSDLNGNFSLLMLRVIQVIVEYHKKHTESPTIAMLIHHVSGFLKLEDDDGKKEFIYCMNRLLSPVIKLAFVDANHNFDNYEMLIKCHQARIHPTWGGILYYNNLLHMITYVSECFLRLKWDIFSIRITYDHEKISSRMKALRICLMNFYNVDIDQMLSYRRMHKKTNNYLIDKHISIDIATSMGASYFNIVSNMNHFSVDTKIEMQNWLSFLITIFNYELKEWGVKRDKISSLITEYNDVLKRINIK